MKVFEWYNCWFWWWRKEPWAKESEQLLEAGKGKETDSPLDYRKACSPANTSILAKWDPFCTSEIWNCKIISMSWLSPYIWSKWYSKNRKLIQKHVEVLIFIWTSRIPKVMVLSAANTICPLSRLSSYFIIHLVCPCPSFSLLLSNGLSTWKLFRGHPLGIRAEIYGSGLCPKLLLTPKKHTKTLSSDLLVSFFFSMQMCSVVCPSL